MRFYSSIGSGLAWSYLVSCDQPLPRGVPFQHGDFGIVLGVTGECGHGPGFPVHYPTRHHTYSNKTWKQVHTSHSQPVMSWAIISMGGADALPSAHPMARILPLGCHAITVTAAEWLMMELRMSPPCNVSVRRNETMIWCQISFLQCACTHTSLLTNRTWKFSRSFSSRRLDAKAAMGSLELQQTLSTIVSKSTLHGWSTNTAISQFQSDGAQCKNVNQTELYNECRNRQFLSCVWIENETPKTTHDSQYRFEKPKGNKVGFWYLTTPHI